MGHILSTDDRVKHNLVHGSFGPVPMLISAKHSLTIVQERLGIPLKGWVPVFIFILFYFIYLFIYLFFLRKEHGTHLINQKNHSSKGLKFNTSLLILYAKTVTKKPPTASRR